MTLSGVVSDPEKVDAHTASGAELYKPSNDDERCQDQG